MIAVMRVVCVTLRKSSDATIFQEGVGRDREGRL